MVTRSSTVRISSSLTPTSEALYIFFTIGSVFSSCQVFSTLLMILRPFSLQDPAEFLPLEIQLNFHLSLPTVRISSSLTPTSEALYIFFTIGSVFSSYQVFSTLLMILRPFSLQDPAELLPLEIQLKFHLSLP